MRTHKPLMLSALVMSGTVLAYSSAAAAQDMPATTTPVTASPEQTDPVNTGGDIVVTAQKRAENVRDVPISITAIGGAHLETLAVRDVQDLTAYVPSFRVTQPGNAAVSALSLRGVGQRDINVHNEGAVAMFADGAYVSFIPAIAQPLFDLERVEILKGPQRTLFGRNATGGLISVVSKRPSDTFDAYALAQYGSYNELKLEGALGGGLAQGISARASVNSTRSDGYIKNSNGPALNANDSLAGRLKSCSNQAAISAFWFRRAVGASLTVPALGSRRRPISRTQPARSVAQQVTRNMRVFVPA